MPEPPPPVFPTRAELLAKYAPLKAAFEASAHSLRDWDPDSANAWLSSHGAQIDAARIELESKKGSSSHEAEAARFTELVVKYNNVLNRNKEAVAEVMNKNRVKANICDHIRDIVEVWHKAISFYTTN